MGLRDKKTKRKNRPRETVPTLLFIKKRKRAEKICESKLMKL